MGKIWYLSPSNQGANVGVDNYGSEKEQMYLLVDVITPHLDRAGVSFVVADGDTSIQDRTRDSNDLGAGFHLCLHSNAGGNGKAWGPVALYYSDAGKAFGERLVTALLKLGQKNNRSTSLVQRKDLWELRKSKAPACLLEVDFHDSVVGVDFITRRRQEIGEAIARCIIEADGKEFVPATSDESTSLCIQWGLFNPTDGKSWEAALTRREAAALVVRLRDLVAKEVNKA